jgi:tetratricopeptide (TPR) repeat protein
VAASAPAVYAGLLVVGRPVLRLREIPDGDDPGAASLCRSAFVNLPVRATSTDWAYRVATILHLPRQLETSATAHYNLGVLYAREGDLERAEKEFRNALGQETRSPWVYIELGKVLARTGRHREAIEMCRIALRIEPGNSSTHHVLGLLYRGIGDIDNAVASFREALRLEPTRWDSARQLSELGASP